jgi:hypothetical protein
MSSKHHRGFVATWSTWYGHEPVSMVCILEPNHKGLELVNLAGDSLGEVTAAAEHASSGSATSPHLTYKFPATAAYPPVANHQVARTSEPLECGAE